METKKILIDNKEFNVPVEETVKLNSQVELPKSELLRDMLYVSQHTSLSKVNSGLLQTWKDILFQVNSERIVYLVYTKNKKEYKKYLAK